jgi:hypothetical protein
MIRKLPEVGAKGNQDLSVISLGELIPILRNKTFILILNLNKTRNQFFLIYMR